MRVLTVCESIWLNCPPAEVWTILEALEGWSDWCPGIRSTRWVGDPGWIVGHRFACVARKSRLTLRPGGRILAVEPARELRWTGWLLTFPAELWLAVQGEGCGTRVTFGSAYRGVGAWLAGRERTAPRIAEFHQGFLEGLRGAAERVMGKLT
ncbi:MAG: SRPBCC family protein [Planctomycetota bacterium]